MIYCKQLILEQKKRRVGTREEKRREEKFVTRVGPAESEPNKTLKLVGTATPPKEKFYKRVGLTEITESSPTKTLKLLRTATPSDEKESKKRNKIDRNHEKEEE